MDGSTRDSRSPQLLYVYREWPPFPSVYSAWFPAASYPNDVVIPDELVTG